MKMKESIMNEREERIGFFINQGREERDPRRTQKLEIEGDKVKISNKKINGAVKIFLEVKRESN